jgi:hypothetical protein
MSMRVLRRRGVAGFTPRLVGSYPIIHNFSIMFVQNLGYVPAHYYFNDWVFDRQWGTQADNWGSSFEFWGLDERGAWDENLVYYTGFPDYSSDEPYLTQYGGGWAPMVPGTYEFAVSGQIEFLTGEIYDANPTDTARWQYTGPPGIPSVFDPSNITYYDTGSSVPDFYYPDAWLPSDVFRHVPIRQPRWLTVTAPGEEESRFPDVLDEIHASGIYTGWRDSIPPDGDDDWIYFGIYDHAMAKSIANPEYTFIVDDHKTSSTVMPFSYTHTEVFTDITESIHYRRVFQNPDTAVWLTGFASDERRIGYSINPVVITRVA